MRSIERRFNIFKQKHPYLGDFTIMMKTVKGQKYTREVIYSWFDKLVNKEEYSEEDKKMLTLDLHKLTNMCEEPTFRG